MRPPSSWLRSLGCSRRPNHPDDGADLLGRHVAEVRRAPGAGEVALGWRSRRPPVVRFLFVVQVPHARDQRDVSVLYGPTGRCRASQAAVLAEVECAIINVFSGWAIRACRASSDVNDATLCSASASADVVSRTSAMTPAAGPGVSTRLGAPRTNRRRCAGCLAAWRARARNWSAAPGPRADGRSG
jgi:hypothetical protein